MPGSYRSSYSADFLQSVLDNSSDAILVLEPDQNHPASYCVRLANLAAGDLVRQAPGHLINQSFSAVFPFLQQPAVLSQLADTIDTRQSQQLDLAVQVPENRWYSLKATWLDNRIVLTIEDVTQAKEAERSLRNTVDLLQKMMDSTPTAVMCFQAVRDQASGPIIDFEWISLNQKAAEITERPVHEVVGRRMLDIHPHNKSMGLFDRYVQVVDTGQTDRIEVAYRADGVDGWYDITAIKQGDGMILIILDITASKQTEQALSHQSEQLQTTLDASLNSILLMTAIRDGEPIPEYPKGRIVDFMMVMANEAVVQSLGHTPEEMAGVTMLTMFPGNIESGLFDIYARVTDTGLSERAIQYYTDDKGLDGWFEVQAVKQGEDGVVLTFMNITEAKRFEQQLQRSNDSLQQFAYVASHDLQEPLRKIMAFGNILASEYADRLSESGADLIDRMQSAASRMQILIKDLLTFSRLTTQSPALRPVDLNAVLIGVLSDLETTITNRRAILHIDPLPMVKGDELQLRQLFQNLLSNALKFVEPGARPEIRITASPADSKQLPPGLSGRYELIQVTDKGIGFDQQHSERIFGTFQRLHGRSQYEGTGIGLAIVKQVVSLHKGYIKAESEPGRGATFMIYLPG